MVIMAGIYCVFLLTALAVGLADEDVEGGKCERIQLPLCQDLGYNWTSMPNLMGHHDQKEAEEAMSQFSGVLESGCSAHARFLLCSAHAPLCSAQVAGAVSACRALCEAVTEQCRTELHALPAAARLDCAAFPLRADRRLCMRPPNDTVPEPPAPRLQPALRAPPALRPPAACEPADYSDAGELWVSALAWLALLSTGFALLTFLAEPARFRYPERPAAWLAACHALVAAAHAARGAAGGGGGAGAAGCAGDDAPAPWCVAFFTVSYYFTLAADAWFANLCVAWYLTAASEWSAEALERAGAYLHALAWGWAGAWTAAALALRRVAGAGRGACGVADAAAGALLGVPRGALLLAGALLACAAVPGVLRVRRVLDARGARRVGRLAARAAAVGALYFVLAAAATAARMVEAAARQGGAAGGAGGWAARLLLAGGVAAGAWAWSRKSALVWRRALCPPRKAPCPAPPLLRPVHPYYKRPLHVSRV